MAKYTTNQLGGWRTELYLSKEFRKEGLREGDVYQFGVFGGFSLQVLGQLLKNIPNFNPRYFGFDVFTGMPVETNEPDKQRDEPGYFNLMEHYGVTDLSSALRMLHFDISSNLKGRSELILIPGLVQETLTENLIKTHAFKPAFYVDMDMDIYSPTKFALEFLIENRIIVAGTKIGFDDWGQNYPTTPIFGCGESRAFKEVSEKYGIKSKKIYSAKDEAQAGFIITEIAYQI